MQITETVSDGVVFVELAGRLDTDAAPLLEERIRAMMTSQPRHLLLDFSHVVYVSSSGLRVLLVLARAAQRHDRRLVLVAVDEIVYHVFDINGFARLLTFAPTRAAACALVGEPPPSRADGTGPSGR